MLRPLAVAAALVLTLVFGGTTPAHALDAASAVCRQGLTKSALKFIGKALKVNEKCNDNNLKAAGSCPASTVTDATSVLVQKLRDGIDKKCPPTAVTTAMLFNPMGYPGKCTDANVSDGFVISDLKDCIQTSHTAAVNALLGIEYNTTAQLADSPLKCQKAIAKNGIKLATAELKAIQKCRNGLEASPPKITGILGKDCATSDPTGKTQAAIAKAESKARAGITSKCPVATDLTTIGICSNPYCVPYCGTCDATCVGDCIVATHHKQVDGTESDFSDAIDFEYATPNVCGDQAVDPTAEECDGTEDGACPGSCGTPGGPFPCLCTNIPREGVVEHKQTDLDLGWTGTSHDLGIVEGSGYVLDLYDCDGPSGPDTLCNVGPTCSLAPHSSCALPKNSTGDADAICAGLSQGTCRKDVTATGPHCKFDIKKGCNSLADCPGFGNACVQTFYGPPLPLSSASIGVCVLNTFTEDVVGTKDLATGSAALYIRQNSQTWGVFGAPQPCPVCGGFCAAPQGGNRHLCTIDADCADVAPVHHCVTDHVCSTGTNVDKECRHDSPFGGPTDQLGNPSVDCPPGGIGGGSIIGNIDIIFTPATTGTTTMLPSFQCDAAAFSGKVCAGGTNNGAPCTVDSECPGGGAGCRQQCFCAPGGSPPERPNGCDPACVGGGNDGGMCISDPSECPGGFCHLADCRQDFTAPAALQPNEGACTQTFEGHCSTTSYRGCNGDFDCTAVGGCGFCQGGETCTYTNKNCFINSGIVRQGVPDVTNPQSAAVFCITATTSPTVNGVAGLPGPGALHQPTTVTDTGF